ncbi:cation transporter [Actinospica sp. MGRD01-02]|uniref:Cation transporter n=1 Tax=Actinospica acidithermotolerans TaxID=2828514 RepID=A0A941IKZ1_9ACTN|nr:cation diffusion facilitator family transporter [Actinospica acidithermotolerans]MBR7829452.1 cation transporter [Actinospica acidithermotolerans]
MAQRHGEDGRDGHGHAAHDHGSRDHGAHDHGAHDHGASVTADTDRRLLLGALGLILGYMLVEVVIGLAASSLALISDAGHMLTDAFSLVLALAAMRLAARPARGRWTFGFKRAEILSAQVNGITLLVLVGIFVYEAVDRLLHPPVVDGALVTATAIAGIVVNAGAALLINRANRSSLNVEGAFQHILNDAWAFLATAVAGIVIMATGFDRADAVASLVVAALMAKAGYGLVRESWKVLLEAAPEGVDPVELAARLRAAENVAQVHDLHVWTITSGFPALSAHVLVAPGRDCHAVRLELEELLRHDYGIEHTTLQVEHAPSEILTIGHGAPGAEEHPAGHCG